MASLAELARFFTRLDAPAGRAPAAAGRRAGACWPTSASPTCCCSRRSASAARRRQPLRRARPGAARPRPDPLPGRLGRHRARRAATARWSPGPTGSARSSRARSPIPPLRERVRVLCIPVRCEGEVDRRADPRVGAVGRPPARRARAHLRRGLQPLRPHDRRRRLPVRRRGRRDRGGAPGRRRRASCSTRAGRVEYASPNAVSTLHRMGVHANAEGLRLSASWASRRSVVRTAFAIGVPVTEEIDAGHDVTVLMRCIPLLDHGDGHRRRRAAARHLRAAPPGPAAALEGRHHPRDPPPGEEQPADDLVAAAPAGPPARAARGQARPSRSRCGASARSPSCTRSCRARRATTCRSSRSSRPLVRMVEEALTSPERPIRFDGRGRRRHRCRPAWPRRWPSCSTSCCRTPSTTPTRASSTSRARRGKVRVDDRARPTRRCGVRVTDDGVGPADGVRPRGVDGPGPVDRAHARHQRAVGARSACATASGGGDRPGTRVHAARADPRRRRRPRRGEVEIAMSA